MLVSRRLFFPPRHDVDMDPDLIADDVGIAPFTLPDPVLGAADRDIARRPRQQLSGIDAVVADVELERHDDLLRDVADGQPGRGLVVVAALAAQRRGDKASLAKPLDGKPIRTLEL